LGRRRLLVPPVLAEEDEMLEDLLQGPHLVILVLVLVLLFGGKRLPEVARGLGQSLRVFKSEVKAPVEPEGDAAEQRAVAAAPGGAPAPESGQPVVPTRETRER
jgi:sec-independent protein translocase protein TatA